jgi:hypothetical protein
MLRHPLTSCAFGRRSYPDTRGRRRCTCFRLGAYIWSAAGPDPLGADSVRPVGDRLCSRGGPEPTSALANGGSPASNYGGRPAWPRLRSPRESVRTLGLERAASVTDGGTIGS